MKKNRDGSPTGKELTTSSTHIDAFDGLRGLAILVVFTFHFTGIYASTNYFLSPNGVAHNIVSLFRAGHVGVDLFFILSGYLIFRSISGKQQRTTFIKRRILRLLPAHLAACLYIAYVTHSWDLLTLISNITFVAPLIQSIHTLNDVTWSLAWEWIFYVLIFLGAQVFNTKGIQLLIVTTLLAVATSLVSHHISGINPIDLGRFAAFLIGVGLAIRPEFSRPTHSIGKSNAIAVAAFLALLTMMSLWLHAWQRISTLALDGGYYIAVSLLFSVLIRESFVSGSMTRKILCLGPIRALGKISYSLYLVHSVVIGTLFNELPPATSFSDILMRYIQILVAAVAIASVSYFILERPYFSRRTRKPSELTVELGK
ncbi:acyltransferase family protein [Pandoraea terrigena]|uniref:Acyltransferase n=1 Tax=Pandoraea terrigena TaxID=2508292 RepID=A0A5E4VA43_9BURK|nr:acyltransferase [Pandoraea terrigena]VVE07770.1 acyltransferase [Pandoraea terrigena]